MTLAPMFAVIAALFFVAWNETIFSSNFSSTVFLTSFLLNDSLLHLSFSYC